ncbi:unnamed protein product [Caenorhabditis sp. 36 PRJEB53466]|nr:unnamed protein product [Caenorhabditis sp. 36 PRJEB53466]
MLSAWISFAASVSYGIPSVSLYLLTSYIILKHRKTFNSSFFHLYIYDGFMNLFTYFTGFFSMRLSSITCRDCLFSPFYTNVGRFFSMKFVIAMGYHMAYVQYSITTLIALNRLSVLLKFNVCEPLWKKYTWIAILLIYFLPFINTGLVFKYNAQVVYLDEYECYSIVSSQLPVLELYSVLIPFMLITIIISVCSNITSVCIVRNVSTQKKNRADVNFLIIMCITCTVQVVGTVISVSILHMGSSTLMLILAMVLPYVSDGLSLVQPWLLVAFSHTLREKMRLMFGWKRRDNPAQNPMFVQRSVTN